jgi:hypothetical protein
LMDVITGATKTASRRVDFAAVKSASINAACSLVPCWLPSGRREGNEWVVRNPLRDDTTPGSFKVNMRDGFYKDFASGEGGDLIDLFGRLNNLSPLEAARALGEILGVPLQSNVARLHKVACGGAPTITPLAPRARELMSPELSQRDPETFPPRTPPDDRKKTSFIVAGDDGPPIFTDEQRRHPYKAGTIPIKIKVMRRNGDARIWYGVSDGAATGWQSRKPVGFCGLAFIGCLDPLDPERINEPVYWPEGEKDVESVTAKGALAMTFGGVGDGLPSGCEEYFRGRHVIILADNDAPGRKHAEEKAALVFPVAATVKIVHFRELPHKGDVTDYFQFSRSLVDLERIVSMTMPYKPRVAPFAEAIAEPVLQRLPAIRATAYAWTDPTSIPRRDFVYGRHLIRMFVSATVAPGGVGKSSLIATEVLAMVSGANLLGVQPHGRSRVWLWNLEDPLEEIARHLQAAALRFNLNPTDVEGHLWVDSGREQRLVTAVSARDGVVILEPVIAGLVAEINDRQLDVLIIDPFVSSHEASENDNPAMDRIVKAWGRVAQLGNCAIELVHHARKNTSGDTEITVESSRGGKALTDGCRSVRVLNRMTEGEAEKAGIENHRLHFRTYVDKGNLAPPAEKSEWFKLESVDLGNGTNGGFGDSIGVVVPWEWPDAFAGVTGDAVQSVFDAINSGSWRDDVQSPEWVGKAVAKAMKLNLDERADKARAKSLIKIWKEKGSLVVVDGKDNKGRIKKFVEVADAQK